MASSDEQSISIHTDSVQARAQPKVQVPLGATDRSTASLSAAGLLLGRIRLKSVARIERTSERERDLSVRSIVPIWNNPRWSVSSTKPNKRRSGCMETTRLHPSHLPGPKRKSANNKFS